MNKIIAIIHIESIFEHFESICRGFMMLLCSYDIQLNSSSWSLGSITLNRIFSMVGMMSLLWIHVKVTGIAGICSALCSSTVFILSALFAYSFGWVLLDSFWCLFSAIQCLIGVWTLNSFWREMTLYYLQEPHLRFLEGDLIWGSYLMFWVLMKVIRFTWENCASVVLFCQVLWSSDELWYIYAICIFSEISTDWFPVI